MIYELGSDGVYTIVITATGSSDSIIIGNPVSDPYRLDVASRTLPVATPENIAYDPEDVPSISWTVPSDYMIASYDVTVNGLLVADDITGDDMAAMSFDLAEALPAGETSTVTVTANAALSDEGYCIGYTDSTGTKEFTVFAPPEIVGFDSEDPAVLLFNISEPTEIAADDYGLQIFENGVPYGDPFAISFNGTDAEVDLTSFISEVTVAANIGNVYTFSLMAIGNNDNAQDVTTFDSEWSTMDESIYYEVPEGANMLAQLSNIRLVSVSDGAAIQLHWDAVPGAEDYTIQCTGGEYNPGTTGKTYIDVTDCIASTTLVDPHTFTIVANPSDADVNSPSTTTAVLERLETPVFTGITGEEGDYQINWNAVDNATGYAYLDADADEDLLPDVLSHAVTPEVTPEDVQLTALGTPYGTVKAPEAGVSTFYLDSAAATQEISRMAAPDNFMVGETSEVVPRQYLQWDGAAAGNYLAEPDGQEAQELGTGLLYLPTSWIADGEGLDISVITLSEDSFIVDSYAVVETVSRALAPMDVAVNDENYQMTWTAPLDYAGEYDMKVTLEGMTHLTNVGLTNADAAGYDLVPLLQTLKNGQWGIWLRSSLDGAGLVLPSGWALNTFIIWEGFGGVPVATPENLVYDPDTETFSWDIADLAHITGFTVMRGDEVVDIVDPVAGTLSYDLVIPSADFVPGSAEPEQNIVTVTANTAMGSGYAPTSSSLDVTAYTDPADLLLTAATEEDPACLSWTASDPAGATYRIAVFNEDGSAYEPLTPGAEIAPVETDETSYDLTAILVALNIEENYGETFKFGVQAINKINEIGTDYVLTDVENSYTVATVALPFVEEATLYTNAPTDEYYYLKWPVGEKVDHYVVTYNETDTTATIASGIARINLYGLSGAGPFVYEITAYPSAANTGKYTPTTTTVTLTRLGDVTFTALEEAASGYDLTWEALTGAEGYLASVDGAADVSLTEPKVNFDFGGDLSLDIDVKALAGIDNAGNTASEDGGAIALYLDARNYATQTVTKLATPEKIRLAKESTPYPHYEDPYFLIWDGVGDHYSVSIDGDSPENVSDESLYLSYYGFLDGSTHTADVRAYPAETALFTAPSEPANFTFYKANGPEDVALNSGVLSWAVPTLPIEPSITGYSIMVWDVSSFNLLEAEIMGDISSLFEGFEPIFSDDSVNPALGSYDLTDILSAPGEYLVGIRANGDISAFVMDSNLVFDDSAEGLIVPIMVLDPNGNPYQDIDDVQIVVKNGAGDELFTVDYASIYGINLYLQAGTYQFGVFAGRQPNGLG